MNKKPLTPFQRALLEVQLEQWRDVPAEKDIDLQPSKEFAKKSRKLIEDAKRGNVGKMSTALRRIILVAAIIAALAGTALAIPAVREGIIRFFISYAGTHYEFSFDQEQAASAPDKIEKVYKPTYIPEGFVQTEEFIGFGYVCYIWFFGPKNYIAFDQRTIPNDFEGPQPDAEDVDTYIRNLNGYNVFEVHCDGVVAYYWTNSEYLFILTFGSPVSQEDREKVFCSIKCDE